MPYTDYAGLVKYCDLNQVDFVFLEHRKIKKFPFLKAFLKEHVPLEFSLLYKGADALGYNIELYRFHRRTEPIAQVGQYYPEPPNDALTLSHITIPTTAINSLNVLP